MFISTGILSRTAGPNKGTTGADDGHYGQDQRNDVSEAAATAISRYALVPYGTGWAGGAGGAG